MFFVYCMRKSCKQLQRHVRDSIVTVDAKRIDHWANIILRRRRLMFDDAIRNVNEFDPSRWKMLTDDSEIWVKSAHPIDAEQQDMKELVTEFREVKIEMNWPHSLKCAYELCAHETSEKRWFCFFNNNDWRSTAVKREYEGVDSSSGGSTRGEQTHMRYIRCAFQANSFHWAVRHPHKRRTTAISSRIGARMIFAYTAR